MSGAIVSDYMTDFPISIDAGATLADVDSLMQANGFRHLPVLRDGEPVGIFITADALRALSVFSKKRG